MALILAINTDGRQTAALERLARELQGHELMGAASCAVAISAIDRRVPDLVLLPPVPETGQADLLSHLLGVPGGVRTLTLPPFSSDAQAQAESSRSFADQVRRCLATGPGRPQLVAAGFAIVSWIRARRAIWADAPAPRAPVPAHVQAMVPEAVPSIAAWRRPKTAVEDEAGPSLMSSASAAAREWREPATEWLPRVAALAVVLAVAGAGFVYWPKLRGALTNGVVVLESGPSGSQVFIDGRLAGTTPVTADLPAGSHAIEFRNGDMSRTTQIVVVARARQVQRVDWMAKPTGGLRVDSEPAGARVLVDGSVRGTTPLALDGLSVGAHTVTIESREGSVRRAVTIADGQTIQLNESIAAATLAVFAPFEIEISEGNTPLRLDERGRTMLSPGPHKLRVRNSTLGYDEVRTVVVLPGQVNTLNLVPQTTITITSTEPAEVTIDGTSVGQTPIVNRRLNIGTRLIVLKPASGDPRQFSVTATPKPIQLEVDFSKP